MLSKLAYWSGYASIMGGLLFGVAVVLHPLRDGISIFNSGVAYGAIHNVGVFGLMFQLFGLVGLYIREADTMGRRGLIAFSDKRTKQSHRAPFLESVRSQRPGRLE
jgi:hypothetical protein